MSKERVQETFIDRFTYELPDDRIAKYPVEPRDESKLLIYKEGKILDRTYVELADALPEDTLLVMNDTKVVEARLIFTKATGGKIEIFCLEPADKYKNIQLAMLEQDTVHWKCLVGGAKKWKEPHLELSIELEDALILLSAAKAENRGDHYIIEFKWNRPKTSFAEILHLAGVIPLPPYLNRTSEREDEERYQTIYAQHDGSVAAPTAGLHFTDRIFDRLSKKNILHDFVTLHVGAGTFAPVKSEKLADHAMHAEFIDVSIEFLENWLKRIDSNLICVGTTSLRTLESLYWIGVKMIKNNELSLEDIGLKQWEAYELPQQVTVKAAIQMLLMDLNKRGMDRLITKTQLLIGPGYEIRTVAGILTNFHQPQSTLLLLIHAFVGDDWKRIYEHALTNDYRFLSFGDGSLLWNIRTIA